MGWSLPDVPARPDAQPWSPWVCLSIIFIGVFAALVRVVLSSPAGGLPALESGYWLPLTGYTASGIMIAITFYSLSWEIRTFLVRNWNNWRRNMHLAWQYQAHQHLCVVQHVMLTADPAYRRRVTAGGAGSGRGYSRLAVSGAGNPLTAIRRPGCGGAAERQRGESHVARHDRQRTVADGYCFRPGAAGAGAGTGGISEKPAGRLVIRPPADKKLAS